MENLPLEPEHLAIAVDTLISLVIMISAVFAASIRRLARPGRGKIPDRFPDTLPRAVQAVMKETGLSGVEARWLVIRLPLHLALVGPYFSQYHVHLNKERAAPLVFRGTARCMQAVIAGLQFRVRTCRSPSE